MEITVAMAASVDRYYSNSIYRHTTYVGDVPLFYIVLRIGDIEKS